MSVCALCGGEDTHGHHGTEQPGDCSPVATHENRRAASVAALETVAKDESRDVSLRIGCQQELSWRAYYRKDDAASAALAPEVS